MKYLIFARRQHDKPVEYRGDVEADLDVAAQSALEQCPGDWVELTLVPLTAAYWVIGKPAEETLTV